MQPKRPRDKIHVQTKMEMRTWTGMHVVNLPIGQRNIAPAPSLTERVGIFAGCLAGIISFSLAFLAMPLTDAVRSPAGTIALNWFFSEQWWPFSVFLGVGIMALILVGVLMNKTVLHPGYPDDYELKN